MNIIAWDIGGAHLKAVLFDEKKRHLTTHHMPTPLWRNKDSLQQSFAKTLAHWHITKAQHLITMSGEMADCFANRKEGVRAIINIAKKSLGNSLHIYGAHGFNVSYDDIASMNWHASCVFLRECVKDGEALFMDMGTTTTDILPLNLSLNDIKARSDHERLCDGSLLYRGVVRTPVMALGDSLMFRGAPTSLMAEHFATTADVFRLLGTLPEKYDQLPSCDHAPKTTQHSAQRLLRMVGLDNELDNEDEQKARDLAHQCASILKGELKKYLGGAKTIIGAGCGNFLIKEVAHEMGCDYRPFHYFVPASMDDPLAIDACAPSVSMIFLFMTPSNSRTL